MNKQLQFLLYATPQEDIKVNVVVKDETLWLTQKAMSELFNVGVPAISKHIKNIFEESELIEEATISKMETVVNRGFRGEVNEVIDFYNLDMIIAVGYRVNSKRATAFRIWATQTLKEFIVKGFVLDDERLKQGKATFGKDYFRELLDRVRSIRASERRIWQQITDIFAECSIDYDRNADITKESLANQRFTFLTRKKSFLDKIDMKFFFYYCFIIDELCKQSLTLGNFSSVDMNKFRLFPIPTPPLAEQERIVGILDKFDKLVNDISESLPAEIRARRKQYEYYREKLLTFKNVNS